MLLVYAMLKYPIVYSLYIYIAVVVVIALKPLLTIYRVIECMSEFVVLR